MDDRRRAEILKQFGDTLRAYRHRLGVSQEQLASMAGLDRTYVGSVERGERNISLVNIIRLAESLAVPPKDLLEGLGEKAEGS